MELAIQAHVLDFIHNKCINTTIGQPATEVAFSAAKTTINTPPMVYPLLETDEKWENPLTEHRMHSANDRNEPCPAEWGDFVFDQ